MLLEGIEAHIQSLHEYKNQGLASDNESNHTGAQALICTQEKKHRGEKD